MGALVGGTVESYEKLGAFYLGREWDPVARKVTDDLVLYDSRHLTTHAVCVGMTGSGKTGLGLALLEEAAIDGVPAIAIDPKGDLGNLLLTFPRLDPSDFLPWVDPAEAERAGVAVAEHAVRVAERWRTGLAEWGQDGARIARLRASAEIALYTPGNTAGRGLRVLRSFSAPGPALLADADALRDRVQAAVSGLLAFAGVASDPVRGREHVLLQTLLDRAWKSGRDMDLASWIREVQSPPLERIGVLDLESFFPARERFELALALNNLVASPAFTAWDTGEPLDVARLLRTPDGRPRISIVSIAHLADAERMFVVTLLLNEVLAWTRAQSGTSSLRAILYMDEVSGYLPPTASPPAKLPFLTLLKQARAFGVGVVLATQNPVDLDYKALSNAGTWLLGRLQTERDKARVLDGLEGAAGTQGSGFDRARIDAALSGLESRVFLLHDVHEPGPRLFQSRWALSYLRGPLTRAEVQRLHATIEVPLPEAAPAPVREASVPATPGATGERPVLPPGIEETFLAVAERRTTTGVLDPWLLGEARVHYVEARLGVDHWERIALLAPLASRSTDAWETARALDAPVVEVAAPADARFATLPPEAARPKSYESWSRALAAHLARTRALVLLRAPELRLVSRPGEPEGEFRGRLAHVSREVRDAELARLEKRWAPKLARVKERLGRAEDRVGREEAQLGQQQMQTAISVGATVLGALFGRKPVGAGTIGRATTAARGVGRSAREKEDVAAARREVEERRDELLSLERAFAEETAALRSGDPSSVSLEPVEVRARRAGIEVVRVALAWRPT